MKEVQGFRSSGTLDAMAVNIARKQKQRPTNAKIR